MQTRASANVGGSWVAPLLGIDRGSGDFQNDPPRLIMEGCFCSLRQLVQGEWLKQHDQLIEQQQLQQPQQQPPQQQQQQQAPPLPWHYPPASWSSVVQLLETAAAGLKHLHSHPISILHNDLKADNVLLALLPGSASGWQLKLCDFGLSARCDPATGAADVGNVSQATRAPETEMRVDMATQPPRALFKVSQRSDVYGFGEHFGRHMGNRRQLLTLAVDYWLRCAGMLRCITVLLPLKHGGHIVGLVVSCSQGICGLLHGL